MKLSRQKLFRRSRALGGAASLAAGKIRQAQAGVEARDEGRGRRSLRARPQVLPYAKI